VSAESALIVDISAPIVAVNGTVTVTPAGESDEAIANERLPVESAVSGMVRIGGTVAARAASVVWGETL